MRLFLAILLTLFAAPAIQAQTVPPCIPGIYGVQFPGSKIEPGVQGKAGWYAYGWCKQADGSPLAVYLACAAIECLPWDQIGAKFGQLAVNAAKTSKEQAFGGWLVANQAYVCFGPAAEQSIHPNTPRAAACAELVDLMIRDWPAYTPPPTPSTAYVVTGSQAFPLKADGSRSITPWPQAPTKGQACDCASKVVQYGVTFCRVPSLSAAQTVVAGCSLAKP